MNWILFLKLYEEKGLSENLIPRRNKKVVEIFWVQMGFYWTQTYYNFFDVEEDGIEDEEEAGTEERRANRKRKRRKKREEIHFLCLNLFFWTCLYEYR